MNNITLFLKDKKGGYRRGLQLLKTVHFRTADIAELSAFVKRQFAPLWAEKKLHELLRGYAPADSVIEFENGAKIVFEKDPSFAHKRGFNDGEPAIIKQLRETEKELREKRSTLQSALEDTEDQQLRAEMVLSIRSLTGQIDGCWTKLDNYELDKIIPAETPQDPSVEAPTAFELQKKLLSIKPRISKLNALLNSDLPASKRIRYERELTEKTAELEVIKKQLP
jgi:hypothetical protein